MASTVAVGGLTVGASAALYPTVVGLTAGAGVAAGGLDTSTLGASALVAATTEPLGAGGGGGADGSGLLTGGGLLGTVAEASCTGAVGAGRARLLPVSNVKGGGLGGDNATLL